MANYFYFDASGRKFGPVNDTQLKALAAQGVITPITPMETDTGYRGQAGQIPGLFAVPTPASPFTAAIRQNQSGSYQPPAPQAGSGKATTSLILGYIGLLAWIIPLFGLPITITGLVMGIKGNSKAGTILCIIGLVLTIINSAIGAYKGATGQLF